MTLTTDIKVPNLTPENEGEDTEVEIEVEVSFEVQGKHIPAIRDVSPEEWPEVEIESVVDGSGKNWVKELTESQLTELNEQAQRYAEQDDHDY